MNLTNRDLRKLKGLAQRLEPMLKIGRNGVSAAFVLEMTTALANHELVKIKFDEFKDQKRELANDIAAKTDSRIVMQVGHVSVFYRQQPDAARRKIALPARESGETP